MADDAAIRTVEECIERFEDAIDKCDRGILTTQAMMTLDAKVKEALSKTLVPNSPAFHFFQRLIAHSNPGQQLASTPK